MIVACEAGGAQILSSLVARSNRKEKFLLCLDGPATDIFDQKIGKFTNLPLDIIGLLDPRTSFVLTGTSFIPDHERNAIHAAKQRGVQCAAFLDHWANYVLRFVPVDLHASNLTSGEIEPYLPDFLIVSDKYQYRLAVDSGIPENRLLMKANPYFGEIKQRYDERTKFKPQRTAHGKKCLLYLSEPVFDDVRKSFGNGMAWGYSEWDVVESLIEFFEKSQDRLSRIIFRLHPNEDVDKYDHLLDQYMGVAPLLKSKGVDILDDILKSDVVLGIETMGLVIALICGKTVFSYLPASAKREECLPHKEIDRISELERLWEE